MKCPYDEPKCIHLGKDKECAIRTCYDEYDMAEGIPCPDTETEDYWKKIIKQQVADMKVTYNSR